MRSLVHIVEANCNLRRSDIVPGDDEGILKVQGSAVCIGDAETLHGYGPVMNVPLALGHEIVGVVDALGANAPDTLKRHAGRRVIVDDARPCEIASIAARDIGAFARRRATAYRRAAGTKTLAATPMPSLWIAIPCSFHPGRTADRIGHLHRAGGSGVEWLLHEADLKKGESVAVLGTAAWGLPRASWRSIRAPRDWSVRTSRWHGRHWAARGSASRFAANRMSERPASFTMWSSSSPRRRILRSPRCGNGRAPRRVILAGTSMEPSGLVPEFVRRKGLTLKGGAAPPRAPRRAVAIVVSLRDRMTGKLGEVHGLEEAEGRIKGLLCDGVARGAHGHFPSATRGGR